jgi:hypothetical protein
MVDRKLLQRRWVHAQEEDTDGEMVFRPAEEELPPARGRLSLELRADGTMIERQPGPGDLPEEAAGSWELLDDDVLSWKPEDRPERRLKIRALEERRLVLEG